MVGALAGLSAFLGGLYDLDRWGWAAAVTILVGIVVVAGSPALPRGLAALPPLALLALALVQFLSTRWAEDGEQALLAAHRTLFYGLLVGLLIVLFRDSRAPAALLAGVVAGTVAVGAYDLIVMIGDPDQGLFFRGRLDEPLGYVNGQAAIFAFACWPLMSVAERAHRRLVAGAAAAGAGMLLCLVVLTASRGALAALIAAAIVALVVLPGRVRRLVMFGVLVAALAVAWSSLVEVSTSFDFRSGLVEEAARHRAAIVTLAAGFAAGMIWFGFRLVEAPIAARTGWLRRPAVERGALAAAAAALVIAAVTVGPAAAHAVEDRIDSFKALKPAQANSRLTSAGGNRYDYWRVAVSQFRQWPLRGTAAGNYDRTYFLERRTEEDVRQPHSLEFQALAETGILGALCVAALLVGGAAAVMVSARHVHASRLAPTVACTGIWVTWMVHTSVDWMHLLPGVTVVALAALAFLCSRWDRKSQRRPWRFVRPTLFAGLTIAGASLAILLAADRHRTNAVNTLARDPARAADSARSALKLVPDAPDTYYVLAAAQARANRYEQARATLREASRRKPHAFLPHALLGDLALRRGDRALAQADYERALRLNPRSETLRNAVARAAVTRPTRRRP